MLGVDFKSAVLILFYQRFSLNQMTLRKITIDKSVRYVPKNEKPKEKEIKPNKVKAGSLHPEQNKKPSQNNKKFLVNISTSGFTTLTN